MATFSRKQVLFTLAWISYATNLVIDGPQAMEAAVRRRLASTSPVQGDWDLAWGPASFTLVNGGIFSDNMAYAVVRQGDPTDVVVVIRGTSLVSVANWVIQNLNVITSVPWPVQEPGLAPRIASGTALALATIEGLVPAPGLPGEGKTISQLLAEHLAAHGGTRVTITGHSLGGVLASTFGLRLFETQAQWDPNGRADLDIWSFAAPTAGDGDFAQHISARLGGSLKRIWNTRDVVPCAWDLTLIRRLERTYGPIALGLTAAAWLYQGGKVYRQPSAGDLPFDAPRAFRVDEVLFQHGTAYIRELELEGILSQKDVYTLPGPADTARLEAWSRHMRERR